ncbi:MAG: NUDIX hydrolase [Pseudobdellovibrionaceae bacterium]
MKQSLLTLFKSATPPMDLQARHPKHACVAVILKGLSNEDLEIGFIQRAFNPEDRWSGQLAFPGGTREEKDKTDLEAALRETHEEVGIILEPDELLGRLDDVFVRRDGGISDFYIRPFVFYIQRDIELILNPDEVSDFFWIPLNEIKNPQRQTHYEFAHSSFGTQKFPAIDLDREPPLWGLTYKMVLNLMAHF